MYVYYVGTSLTHHLNSPAKATSLIIIIWQWMKCKHTAQLHAHTEHFILLFQQLPHFCVNILTNKSPAWHTNKPRLPSERDSTAWTKRVSFRS